MTTRRDWSLSTGPRSRTFNSIIIRDGEQSKSLLQSSQNSKSDSDVDTDDEGSQASEEEEYVYSVSRQNRKEKLMSSRHLRVALFITCGLLLILVALLAWQHLSQKEKVCLSEDCVRSSAYILAKLNATHDPCVDFYEYACGGWVKNTFIPPDKAKYGSFSEVEDANNALLKRLLDPTSPLSEYGQSSSAVKKARRFFKNCMDVDTINREGIVPVLQLIKALGSWTVTTDATSGQWNKSTWKLNETLVKSHFLGQSALFTISVTQDDKDSSKNIIKFYQSGLTLSDQSEYLGNKSEKFRKPFLSYATKTAELLQGRNDAATKLEAVFNFEKQLAEIMVPREQLTNPEKTYHKMTVKEFQDLIGPQINIKSYLDHMFAKDIPLSENVLCKVPSYFSKLGPLIESTSKELLANYIVWNTLQTLPGYLPDPFIDAAMVLTKAEIGVSTVSPRWERCVEKTLSTLGFAVSALFVEKKFPPESRDQVQQIVDNLKATLNKAFGSVDWMDEETQQKARDKANHIQNMIGYPDWIRQRANLDKYYEKLNVIDGQFLKNYIDSNKFEVKRILSHYGKPVDRSEWEMMPAAVNAYYTPLNNQIVLPAGILQRPFFDPSFPLSFNYGSIGMVAGHELTHGFDNIGRLFDKSGNLQNWWSKQSKEGFMRSAQCMAHQYSQYLVEGLPLHGNFTLSENIADNGGVKMALHAFRTMKDRYGTRFTKLPALDLTEEQLFFLGFAQNWCSFYTPEYARQSLIIDVHSYAKYRVIGTLSNSKDFAAVFNCPKNSNMNPDLKCQVW